MLTWFREVAPIRTKFRVLTSLQAALAALVIISTVLVVENIVANHLATLVVTLASAISVVVIVGAGKMICDPYVATVVRMEALASGDLDSPVEYTSYQDCVGRLTRAMATFRQQAVDLRHSSRVQDEVVAAMAEALQRLAANDLTARMTKDLPPEYAVLRDNFNHAAEALEQALGSVAAAADDILNGSTEIRAASDDLSGRTEQQAAALEESTASIAEVTGTVQRNASAAQSAAQAVRDVQVEARQGGEVVARAVTAMTAIQSSSDEIAQIVSVIDGIAFQTNLLALNAGVEAARAGESGKGFAVVANEVRALAQRSAEASTQIRGLINASTQQVTDGVGLVGATGEALASIVQRIDQIAGSVGEIADSAIKQSTALEHVSAAASEMDRMTQQNAAMVEQSNAAARQLADQSTQLAQLVNAFHVSRQVSMAGTTRAAPRAAAASRPAPIASSAAPAYRPAPRTAGSAALAVSEDWSEF
ncbi:MAG TPA: methyl-accepting chemotaxis protein [Novosphingobium sp.]